MTLGVARAEPLSEQKMDDGGNPRLKKSDINDGMGTCVRRRLAEHRMTSADRR